MSRYSSCPCKQSQHTPFHCHCTNVPYTCDYVVPLGHVGDARVLDICNPDILGVGIEQAVIGGGPRVFRDANNCSQVACLKTSKSWHNFKEVERCCGDCDMLRFRPWLLTPRGDNAIELPSGCYRFVVYDCDYNLIVPGPKDIAMLLNIEKC